jgi:hypothetical protein
MKPKEKKPVIVYRIISRKTGRPKGSYSRSYHDEYDFNSVEQARTANCHGLFEDKRKYQIAKYKVTYTLLDEDVDNAKDVDPNMRTQKEEEIAEWWREYWCFNKNKGEEDEGTPI